MLSDISLIASNKSFVRTEENVQKVLLTPDVRPRKNDFIQAKRVTESAGVFVFVCPCPRSTRRPQQDRLRPPEAGERCCGGIVKPGQRSVEVRCQPGRS